MCLTCNDSGVVLISPYPGSTFYQACTCEVATQNRIKAEQDHLQLLNQYEASVS